MESKNNLKDIQEKLDELNKKKSLLIQSIGKENFESIVDAIDNQIKMNNLDKTPTILKDLLDYIVNTKTLKETAEEVPVQEQDEFINRIYISDVKLPSNFREELIKQYLRRKKILKTVFFILFLLVCFSIYLSFKLIN